MLFFFVCEKTVYLELRICFILQQSYFGKKDARFAQLKQFEPIQSQEELHIIPGSSATTTVNGIDTASYRNRDRKQVMSESQ